MPEGIKNVPSFVYRPVIWTYLQTSQVRLAVYITARVQGSVDIGTVCPTLILLVPLFSMVAAAI